MKLKVITGITLILFLASILTLAFAIQPIKASRTIYIRADGSLDPPTANITSVDNVTYTFTDNNYDEIVVERDNIVVDGAGYTLQGTGTLDSVEFFSVGINLTGRSNVTINDMKIEAFAYGISLWGSSNNTLSGNEITNNYDGIHLEEASNNSVYGNNITNNVMGIMLIFEYGLPYTNYNIISGNNITNNYYGVFLVSSSYNSLSRNVMNDNKYNFYVWGDELSEFTHSIDVSNLVDGKPVYYLVSQKDLVINPATHPQVGYLALINCENVTVEGLKLTKNYQGLLFAYTNNSRITANNITNNIIGIEFWRSSNNTISGNYITANDRNGIKLEVSLNNSISGNNITNNSGNGIWLWFSSNNMLRNNRMVNNTFNFDVFSLGWSVSDFVNDVDSSNTVDGKPVYYWISKRDMVVPLDAGYVALVDCINITVKNLNLKNNRPGILLVSTNNSKITQNNITNNYYGIWLSWSSNNKFYHNNFINNTQHVCIFRSGYTNLWDDGYPYGGNYWSNYTGVDLYSGPYQNVTGSDGIGDTPYMIDENNRDNYPLMSPWSPKITVEVPFWMRWWFWVIVAVVIVALAGAVYFLKKRKPPITPTLPTEGTLGISIMLTVATSICKRRLLKTPVHQ